METLASSLLTNADLDALDVPFLRELHEGALYVLPSPGYAHQRAVSRLPVLFEPLLPNGLLGLVAPFDFLGRAEGEALFEVEEPFPVRLRPAALFRSGPAH